MPFVRWIGQPDPMDANPEGTREAVGKGLITKEQVWEFNRTRQTAFEGTNVRLLGPDEGMSRWYQWGKEPGSYLIFVDDRDWKRIQSLAEAAQFVLPAED